jgi:D-inositol-3-phosphate glycosyltransferase
MTIYAKDEIPKQLSDSSKIRVVMVEPVGAHGGMDFWNMSMCAALIEEGWRPLLLTSQAMPGRLVNYDVWEIYRGVFGSDPKWVRGVRHVIATLRGLWHARISGARIAHFHFFHVGLLQYFGIVVAHFLGLKVVVSAHDVGSFRPGESLRLLYRLYRKSDALIVYSKEARRKLLETFSVSAEKTFLAPHGNYNGFFTAMPPVDDAKTYFGYDRSHFVILFFGQLKKVKRLDLLLRATVIARARGIGRLRLLVAGSAADSNMAELEHFIETEGLQDVVQIHCRYIENSEIPHYLSAADLMVLPYDNIYQSGVVILAMSHGVPVLTSDIPGMLEVLDNGRTGLTFRAGNADDLADKLIALECGALNTSELARAASKVALRRHSWSKCAQATIAAYRAVLDEDAHQLTAEANHFSGDCR